jgi:tetratricopeptide (TPR) repeat protein
LMAGSTPIDVILLGFRNDLARVRALDLLQQPGFPPHLRIDPSASLPQRIYAGLDAAQARQVSRMLEILGAQVALHPVPDAGSSPAPTRPGKGRRPRPALFRATMLLFAAVAAGYWLRPQPQPPQRSEVIAAAPEEPVAWAAAKLRSFMPALPPQPEELSATLSNDPDVVARNNEAVRLAQAGEFLGAIEELEIALQHAPDDPTLWRNLQTTLLNWGIADLAADRLEDAVLHLEQAAELGERAEVLQTLGIALLRQNRQADAAALLERALDLDPEDHTTLLALADVYLGMDKRPEALDLLHRARETGFSSDDLERRLEQLEREVDVEWEFVEIRDPHFRVSFADDEDYDSVRLILAALDDAYYTVGAKFDHYPHSRTPVVLYTQQDFHAITQTPDWAGGAFDGRIKIPVRGLTHDDPNLARVVRHEYAHSLVAQLAGQRCPVWLNEGLAVWAEESRDGERIAWAQEGISGQHLFTFEQLRTSFANIPADRVQIAYGQSYLAVRALIERYGAHTIPSLLGALGRHGNIQQAFDEVYRDSYGHFQQQVLRQLTH